MNNKQTDSTFPWACSVNRWQTTTKCGTNKEAANKAQPSVSLMFLPKFSRLMWSITVQTQANLESMFDLIEKKKYNVVYDDIIYASILKQITSKNQSTGVYDINESSHPHPYPTPYFWPTTVPLVQISFSSPAFKDGTHNFRSENTEHSLAKITPGIYVC